MVEYGQIFFKKNNLQYYGRIFRCSEAKISFIEANQRLTEDVLPDYEEPFRHYEAVCIHYEESFRRYEAVCIRYEDVFSHYEAVCIRYEAAFSHYEAVFSPRKIAS